MEHFSCQTRIISGDGALSALGELSCRRLLLVTDPYFMKNGVAQRVLQLAQAEQTEIFSNVTADPTVALAAEGTAVVNRLQPDTVIALGGGSAMDCAKAMAYFGGGTPRLVAIPTTSGSGSEVTDFAILTHGQTKHPLVDEKLRPHLAILDSQLLQTLPPSLIADTGFDVLTHALEAWVSTSAGAITDALARDAFTVVCHGLAASFAGDRSVRLQLHTAATMAGMAFTQAGLGLCHALSHSLGGMFHVPHGRLNAVLLPAVVHCNARAAGAKYARLARSAGLNGSSDMLAVRNLKQTLIRLRGQLRLPHTLYQAGIDPARLHAGREQLIRDTLADPCCKTNPLPVDRDTVEQVLGEVTGGG